PANALVAVTLLAMLTGHMRFASDRYWVSGGWLLKLLLSLACIAGWVYLGQQGLRRLSEHRRLMRAAAPRANAEAQLAVLKEAHQVEPMNFETTYKIGEILRAQSWQGDDDMVQRAEEAMSWFKRGMELNRHD